MAFPQPINKFALNKGSAISVWEQVGVGQPFHTIAYGEIFVLSQELNWNETEVKVYHESRGGFVRGRVSTDSGYANPLHSNYNHPYSSAFGYSADAGGNIGYGYTFPIRRDTAFYSGTDFNGMLTAGDAIMTDGESTAGQDYGDRLNVKAVRQNGVWKDLGGVSSNWGWVPTGLRSGYTSQSNMSIYSTKW